MANLNDIRNRVKKILVLNQYTIAILVVCLCLLIVAIVSVSQIWVERGSLPPMGVTGPKEQYEIAKLAAEIRQVRSDTSGSLFWLKLIALFVTVGGAVGGYLIGQSHVAKKRIDFEDRKNVDSAYQALVQELSAKDAPILRAAAAVKLGAILNSFPSEWTVTEARKEQLIELTKQVLAAALAIEDDAKVLKTLTIAIALHKHLPNEHWQMRPDNQAKLYADMRNLDLSGAKAKDAYWASANCSHADFYGAHLQGTSFRNAELQSAQFRNADLQGAVFAGADCTGANFKFADLRGADLSNARFLQANFEGAKIDGCIIDGTVMGDDPATTADAPSAKKPELVSLRQRLRQQ